MDYIKIASRKYKNPLKKKQKCPYGLSPQKLQNHYTKTKIYVLGGFVYFYGEKPFGNF